jgi:hypothetical protein
MQTMPTFLRRVFTFVFRVAAVLAGAVFAVALFFAGALAVAGLLGWSLVRGRRPVVLRSGVFRMKPARPARAESDVVDVVAREVHAPAQQLMRD